MTGLRYFAGALGLCLLCSAQADASCAAKQTFTAFVAERFPHAQVTVLDEIDARLFLAAMNRTARPPLAADGIVIVDVTETGTAVPVALFERGCMTRLGALPRPVMRSILNIIARNGA